MPSPLRRLTPRRVADRLVEQFHLLLRQRRLVGNGNEIRRCAIRRGPICLRFPPKLALRPRTPSITGALRFLRLLDLRALCLGRLGYRDKGIKTENQRQYECEYLGDAHSYFLCRNIPRRNATINDVFSANGASNFPALTFCLIVTGTIGTFPRSYLMVRRSLEQRAQELEPQLPPSLPEPFSIRRLAMIDKSLLQPSTIDPTHPLCPECKSQMRLSQIARKSEERVHQYFECTVCGKETLVTQYES